MNLINVTFILVFLLLLRRRLLRFNQLDKRHTRTFLNIERKFVQCNLLVKIPQINLYSITLLLFANKFEGFSHSQWLKCECIYMVLSHLKKINFLVNEKLYFISSWYTRNLIKKFYSIASRRLCISTQFPIRRLISSIKNNSVSLFLYPLYAH